MIELVRLTDGIKINSPKAVSEYKCTEDKNDFSSILKNSVKANKSMQKTDLDSIFSKASEMYNISVDLIKAVAKTESEFTVDAVSSSGAQGVMQLMPATAQYLGVEDAFDPEQNIMGGTKLLAQLIKQYDGDLDLTLAAYNAGSGNVAKYGGVPPFKETQNYLVKVKRHLGERIDLDSVNKKTNNDDINSVIDTGIRNSVNSTIVREKRLSSQVIENSYTEESEDGDLKKLTDTIKEQIEWENLEKRLSVTPSIFKNNT